MAVIYRYTRYGSLEEDEHDTLFDALERAKRDVEELRGVPEQIVLEDGTVMLEKEIMQRSGYYTDSGPIIDGTISEE